MTAVLAEAHTIVELAEVRSQKAAERSQRLIDTLVNEVRHLTRMQGEHAIACTKSKEASELRWDNLEKVLTAFSESFREHCAADVRFQEEERKERNEETKTASEKAERVRFWIWSALLTGIGIESGAIGWLIHSH